MAAFAALVLATVFTTVAAAGELAPARVSAVTLSASARDFAAWAQRKGDHQGQPFFVVDKRRATLYAFDAKARLLGFSPVLLGAALGDDSVPGIGDRPIAQVRPAERTTPAGRFVAELGRNANGEDVVWVDYDAAVSMHRVRTANAAERRLQRLATPTADDNRISYGCINVPVTFYEAFVKPVFAEQRAVVYVLPDVKTLQQVFGPNAALAVPGPAKRR